MSSKLSSRPRKTRSQKSDEMRQEIVAQVHRTLKRESATSSPNDVVNKTIEAEDSSSRSTSNRTFIVEDKNENYSLHTPSRDMSVDEEAQINSKILSLIETEMRRDINKHSHFTDSRPQSLSFYEDEKIPEELSGNLELLSPEERKHYRRRKDYIDMDLERNAYNNLQDTLMTRCESEDIIGGTNGFKKSSKSRSKKSSKHSGDPEIGLGDSREMMIPKEKRKSKKKSKQQRLENSPVSSSSKRKHRKRDEDPEQPKNEIAMALEELQDDVFEVGSENNYIKSERPSSKKSPSRKSSSVKHYVQRKSNKFELVNPGSGNGGVGGLGMQEDPQKDVAYPIQVATMVQRCWLPLTLICHGFLGGIALGHYFFLKSNSWSVDQDDFYGYAKLSDMYTYLFYVLCVICIVSVFDRYDLSHLDAAHLKDLLEFKKSAIVIVIYVVCLLLHLIAARTDDKFSLLYYNTNNYTSMNVTISEDEIYTWNNLSYWRSIMAIFGWLVIACVPQEDLFYAHIKNMIKYVSEQ